MSNIWKKAYPKLLLNQKLQLLEDGKTIVNYKEDGDKINIRYTYRQTTINKSDIKKYLEPIIVDGKIEECRQEVSDSLDENFKKYKK